jgi:hypothetical protein
MSIILYILWIISFFISFRMLENIFNPKRDSSVRTFINLAVASIPVLNIVVAIVEWEHHDRV